MDYLLLREGGIQAYRSLIIDANETHIITLALIQNVSRDTGFARKTDGIQEINLYSVYTP